MPATIGFVGLGAMGFGMASNLLAKTNELGDTLKVFNRTLSKADALVAQGAVLESGGPAALSRTCDMVFSMVFDDQAVHDTFAAFLQGPPKPGFVYIECGTIHPSTSQAIAAQAAANDIHYVACPVFGRPDAARAKMLVAALAGPAEIKERVRPYVQGMTRSILDIGTDPHTANVQKLVGNFMIVGIIELLAEAQTLGERNGLSRDQTHAFVNFMFGGSPIVNGYSARMAASNFNIVNSEGFPVRGGIKDASLIKRLATESGTAVPIVDIALRHLHHQNDNGHAELDWGSLALAVRHESGSATEPAGQSL